ncbi:hypothetical protein T02_11421, partial [Trichinella nativa]
MQTIWYLLNKLPLKFACAYINTQESSETDTLQKRNQDASILVMEAFSSLLCNISLFLASRFFFIFRPFGINFQSLYLVNLHSVSPL